MFVIYILGYVNKEEFEEDKLVVYVEGIQYFENAYNPSSEFFKGRNPLRKSRHCKKGAIISLEMNEGFIVDSSGVGHLWVAGCCGYFNDLRVPQKEGNFLVSPVPVGF
jgi:L-ascorbate metabolism protein UlaG (beta-lactamase superfamily)